MADRYVILFFIFSVLGYCSEVIYCSVPQHRFVNRGFLYGPYLPIYGFGAMIVIIVLRPFMDYPVAIFLLGLILTSVLEYITSWALEKLFSIKLWDYSKHRVNINGRVCLLNSSLFGIMGLVVAYGVYPCLSRLVAHIPSAMQHYASMLIVAILSVDTTLSALKMKSFRDALEHIHAARLDLESRVRALEGQGKAELARELRARIETNIERMAEDVRKKSEHIMRANPTITARREELRTGLEILRERLRTQRAQVKKHAEDALSAIQDRKEEIRKKR